MLTDRGPDLAKLLVGSEGTLGFVTAATLRTVPLAGGTCVALLGFPTLDAAVRAGLDLRRFEPVACDLLDRRLLSVTRPRPTASARSRRRSGRRCSSRSRPTPSARRPSGRGAWSRHCDTSHLMRVLAEPTCRRRGRRGVRGVREAAVAGLYSLGRGPRPLAFIEDVGVPADALPEFLAGVQDILKRFELSGVVPHPRAHRPGPHPAARRPRRPGRPGEALAGRGGGPPLALSLGGTVSTQHGTGIARTPWVERQYGPLYPVFRELKRIFDPKNLLNPGKIVGPDPSREAWPLRAGGRRQEAGDRGQETGNATATARDLPRLRDSRAPTPLLVWKDSTPDAEVGAVYRVRRLPHRDRAASGCARCSARPATRPPPRGRRRTCCRVLDDPAIADAGRGAGGRGPVRELQDVPRRVRRPREHPQADAGGEGRAPRRARARPGRLGPGPRRGLRCRSAATSPRSSTACSARRPVRWVLEKLFGLSRRRRLPAFALRNFFRRARGHGLTRRKPPESNRLGRDPHRNAKVAYFVDIFASYNDPLIGEAAVAVLQHNGIEVYVPPRQVGCGMAALAVGDVETAREAALRNVRVLADLVREGYRIVCSEPTAALMLTQDYLDLLDDPDTASVAAQHGRADDVPRRAARRRPAPHRLPPARPDARAPRPVPPEGAPRAGRRPAAAVADPRAARAHHRRELFGMAGTWGLKAANHATSLAAGRPMLAELDRPGVLFGSTECSTCRMQMQEGTGKRTLHPVQYLAYAYGLMPEIGARS